MESEEGIDILSMFDKLKSTHLNEEGVSILKSMAESIRFALEKGLILEQMLIDQQNKLSKNQQTKKKKKKINTVDEPKTDKNQETIISEFNDDASNLVGSQELPESGSLVQNKVKLVDQSLLIKSPIINQPPERIVSPSCLCNAPRLNPSPSLTNQINHLEPFLLINNNRNQQLSEASSNSSVYEMNDESIVEDNNKSVNNKPSYSSVLQQRVPSLGNPPEQNEEVMMPSPIIVKSEFPRVKPVDSFKPFDNQQKISDQNNEGTDQIISTPNKNQCNITPVPSNEEESVEESSPQKKEHKLYFEGSKGITQEEVLNIFKGLDITFFRIINKVAHSYGFISFAKEDHMKKALSYSNKIINGKSLTIRPFFEKRKSIQNNDSTESQNTNQKRPRFDSLHDKTRTNFQNSTRNYQNINSPGSFSDSEYNRGRNVNNRRSFKRPQSLSKDDRFPYHSNKISPEICSSEDNRNNVSPDAEKNVPLENELNKGSNNLPNKPKMFNRSRPYGRIQNRKCNSQKNIKNGFNKRN